MIPKLYAPDGAALLAWLRDAIVCEVTDIDQWPQFWQLVHTVSVTGGVTSIKIYPRWWAI